MAKSKSNRLFGVVPAAPVELLGVEKTKKLFMFSVVGLAERPVSVPVYEVRVLRFGTREAKLPVSAIMSVDGLNMSDEDVKEPPPGKSITPNVPLISRAALADSPTVNKAIAIAKILNFIVIAMVVKLLFYGTRSASLKSAQE